MLSSTGRGVRDEVDTRPVRRIQDRQAEIGRTSLARSQAGLDRADKSDQTALGDPFALDSGSGLTPELSRADERPRRWDNHSASAETAKRARLERIVRCLSGTAQSLGIGGRSKYGQSATTTAEKTKNEAMQPAVKQRKTNRNLATDMP